MMKLIVMLLAGVILFGIMYIVAADKATQLTVAQQGLVIAEANAAYTRAQAQSLTQMTLNNQLIVYSQVFAQSVLLLVIAGGILISLSTIPLVLVLLIGRHKESPSRAYFLPIYHQNFIEGKYDITDRYTKRLDGVTIQRPD